MRKSYIVIALLLIAGIISICFAHELVNSEKDTVEVDETTLYGDKQAAYGLEILTSTSLDRHLFWNTRHVTGEAPLTETEYEFSQSPRSPVYQLHYNPVEFTSIFSYAGSSTSGNIDLDDTGYASASALYKAVADNTAPGEARTEKLNVSDFYEFYPIEAHMYEFEGNLAVNETTQKSFAEYFRVPVYKGHAVDVTIEKHAAGNITRLDISSVNGGEIRLETPCVTVGDSRYFLPMFTTASGTQLDTSYIKGGYGIYRLPLDADAYPDRVLTADMLEVIYPIDTSAAKPITLKASPDGDKLLLVTADDGRYALTVIDTATSAVLQKLPLMSVTGDDFRDIAIFGSFIMPYTNNGRFAVLPLGPSGEYTVSFVIDSDHDDEQIATLYDAFSADFDGEKLAVASYGSIWETGRYDTCTVMLYVFDKTGLLYHGRYRTGLGRAIMNGSLNCSPYGGAPISVSWRR